MLEKYSNINFDNNSNIENEPPIFTNLCSYGRLKLLQCKYCKKPITEYSHYKIGQGLYHENCVRCVHCMRLLRNLKNCHVKNGNLICEEDRNKYYVYRCLKCLLEITRDDWVRIVERKVFHVNCFCCVGCGRQLKTGDEYCLLNNRISCKLHYQCLINPKPTEQNVLNVKMTNHDKPPSRNTSLQSLSNQQHNSFLNHHHQQQREQFKNKRARTNFNPSQIRILQKSFDTDPNPDAEEIDNLAKLTGLPKRVTQVWFQNQRARQKKLCPLNIKNEPVFAQTSYSNHSQQNSEDSMEFNIEPTSPFEDSEMSQFSSQDSIAS